MGVYSLKNKQLAASPAGQIVIPAAEVVRDVQLFSPTTHRYLVAVLLNNSVQIWNMDPAKKSCLLVQDVKFESKSYISCYMLVHPCAVPTLFLLSSSRPTIMRVTCRGTRLAGVWTYNDQSKVEVEEVSMGSSTITGDVSSSSGALYLFDKGGQSLLLDEATRFGKKRQANGKSSSNSTSESSARPAETIKTSSSSSLAWSLPPSAVHAVSEELVVVCFGSRAKVSTSVGLSLPLKPSSSDPSKPKFQHVLPGTSIYDALHVPDERLLSRLELLRAGEAAASIRLSPTSIIASVSVGAQSTGSGGISMMGNKKVSVEVPSSSSNCEKDGHADDPIIEVIPCKHTPAAASPLESLMSIVSSASSSQGAAGGHSVARGTGSATASPSSHPSTATTATLEFRMRQYPCSTNQPQPQEQEQEQHKEQDTAPHSQPFSVIMQVPINIADLQNPDMVASIMASPHGLGGPRQEQLGGGACFVAVGSSTSAEIAVYRVPSAHLLHQQVGAGATNPSAVLVRTFLLPEKV